jgi:YesN/AraC family two-component response regulator
MRTLLHTVATFKVVYSINGTNIYNEVIANKTDILDINMPEKDGIEVIKEFSKKVFHAK